MRKLVMEMNVSLDGIANHEVAIADDELHQFASDELDKIDLMLFGRVTYQLMESFWPNVHKDPRATGTIIEFADKFNALPKIVFSQSLQKTDWQNSKIVRTSAVEEIQNLKKMPGKSLSIGGISISQEMIKQGLIDEYIILVQPIIWGKGRHLFESLDNIRNLKLVETKTFRSGVVVLRYLSENFAGI